MTAVSLDHGVALDQTIWDYFSSGNNNEEEGWVGQVCSQGLMLLVERTNVLMGPVFSQA